MIEGDNWYLLHLQEELIGAFPKASTNKDDIYVVGGKYGMTRQEIFDLGFQNEEFGNAVFRSDLGGDFMKYTVRRGQGEAAKVIATGMDLAMPLPPMLTLARGVRVRSAFWGKAFNYRHGGQMSSIEHIMYRHSHNTGFSNVSRFSQGTNARMIKGYVDQAVKFGRPIKGGFEYNFGRVIGTGTTGAPASSIRVYVRDGWVRTAFPY